MNGTDERLSILQNNTQSVSKQNLNVCNASVDYVTAVITANGEEAKLDKQPENLEAQCVLGDLHAETSAMGDCNLSPTSAAPRKLPTGIPNMSAGPNASLKGILIKPKRILPPQPDSSKVKRTSQESGGSVNTTTAIIDDPSRVGLNSTAGGVKDQRVDSSKASTVTKLQIDVTRLKTYFETHGKDVLKTERRNTDVNENNIQGDSSEVKSPPARSQSECSNNSAPPGGIVRESTIYNFSPDGLSKVKEWCLPKEINKMTTKMEKGTAERGIRSPSPRSNTTWDRSSSGYSSDERADPRSPPPVAGVPTLKPESDPTDDDGVSMVTDNVNKSVAQNSAKTVSEEETTSSTDSITDSSVLSRDSNSNTVDEDSDKCVNCNASSANQDAVGVHGNIQFDSTAGPKQNLRKPAWSGPSSGRIQYRKSGTESMISLRHTNRQADTNFDGLEVCGKSYPQTTNPAVASQLGSVKNDSASNTPEVSTTSAFNVPERTITVPEMRASGVGSVPRIDVSGQDIRFGRILRQPLTACRSPRDVKGLSHGLNVKLNLSKDDKDIRKTLHDLNSPKRQSPGGRIAPIRARHSIQSPNQAIDSSSPQPIGSAFTTIQRQMNSDGARSGMAFGKKMWRAPSGQPENAQMRPFSPFGGTLPASKIKENETRRHTPDMSD